MTTVVADVGLATANSYVTVAEADAYFSDSFGRPLWITPATTADVKATLVVYASRLLDQYMEWAGSRATDTQSMEWPRIGAYDRFGAMIPSDQIPKQVKYAVFELAYYALENNGLSFADQTIDSVKVGSIQVEFTPKSTDAGIPKFIENLLSGLGMPIIVGASGARNIRLERV